MTNQALTWGVILVISLLVTNGLLFWGSDSVVTRIVMICMATIGMVSAIGFLHANRKR
jgi:hypothetical protein